MAPKNFPIRPSKYMGPENVRSWRDEIDARGYVAKEIHVSMNDNRVVVVKAEHHHGMGHHSHSTKKLFHEFIVPSNVDSASLKCFYDEKRGFVVITGNRNEILLQQQPGVPYSAIMSQAQNPKKVQVSPSL